MTDQQHQHAAAVALNGVRDEIPPDVLAEAGGYCFRAVAIMRERMEKAERELAGLRERLGELVERWGGEVESGAMHGDVLCCVGDLAELRDALEAQP